MTGAGHDQEGELLGNLANQILSCFYNNGNGGQDMDPEDEDCFSRVVSFEGKRFCFTAISSITPSGPTRTTAPTSDSISPRH